MLTVQPMPKWRQQMLNELINAAMTSSGLEGMLRNSFHNYHAHGVDYLCLFRTPALTIKLYFIHDPGLDRFGFLVAPHNHRYHFAQWCLSGKVDNLIFDTDAELFSPAQKWQPWQYCTEAAQRWSNRGPAQRLVADYAHPDTITMVPGMGYILQPRQIHTLAHVQDAVLLTFQYRDECAISTTYFPENEEPPTIAPDLYQTMSKIEALHILDQARYLLEEYGHDRVRGYKVRAE